ncbi:hypothetical protein QT986_22240, partial [Microcoleus sp. herbarium14]
MQNLYVQSAAIALHTLQNLTGLVLTLKPFIGKMYTLEQLQQKNLKELKEIGWQLNVLPANDRRCRQSWIDALVGVNPPLLQLLETPPAAQVEPVSEAIEVQATEPIEFDADEFRQTHAVEIESYFKSFTEADRPPNRGDGRGRVEAEVKVSQSAMAFRPASYGFHDSPVTFSPKFLATYPPYFGEVHYKADCTGQLNLLEPETEDEPPDPDDFESLDAFREAIALWDAQHPEPLEISLDSFCEWAPCPLEWYEPDTSIE